jgi:hypothetical protein
MNARFFACVLNESHSVYAIETAKSQEREKLQKSRANWAA